MTSMQKTSDIFDINDLIGRSYDGLSMAEDGLSLLESKR